MSDSFRALLRSRKFLLAVLDAVTILALYFAGKYFPQFIDDARFLIVTLQPVIIAVIAAYAYEDAKITSAQIAADAQARDGEKRAFT